MLRNNLSKVHGSGYHFRKLPVYYFEYFYRSLALHPGMCNVFPLSLLNAYMTHPTANTRARCGDFACDMITYLRAAVTP